ncbi:MAG: hypothetical protein CBC22_06555 [Alphaproteobacteria bacterium TMED62]|nr:MAG: hypothetical protein CBC22_06555 [Alphaproteobacteria bacterium TMED62]
MENTLFLDKKTIKLIYMIKFFIILFSTLTLSTTAITKQTDAEVNFLNKIFKNQIPKKERLIVKGEYKQKIKAIMGSKYKKRMFSYWQNNTEQVWILNSIGKYKPITAAFITDKCKVKSSHVLVYREQHGYEIKYPAFLLQFKETEMDKTLKLNTKIDNISGATLSVNSMKRMARTALLLSKLSNENSCT